MGRAVLRARPCWAPGGLEPARGRVWEAKWQCQGGEPHVMGRSGPGPGPSAPGMAAPSPPSARGQSAPLHGPAATPLSPGATGAQHRAGAGGTGRRGSGWAGGVQGLSWEGSPGRWWHRCEPGVRRGPVAGWRARAVGQGGGCGWRRGPLAGPGAGPPSLSCWCRASWEAVGFRRLGARLDWFGAPRLRREGGAGDPAPPSQARSAPWALPLWRRQSGGVSGSKQGSQVR